MLASHVTHVSRSADDLYPRSEIDAACVLLPIAVTRRIEVVALGRGSLASNRSASVIGPQIVTDLANGDDKESAIDAIVRKMTLIGVVPELRSAPIRAQCLQGVLAGGGASVTFFDKCDLLPHYRAPFCAAAAVTATARF